MYKRFTCERTVKCHSSNRRKNILSSLTPRNETVAFLLQFACVYHVEKNLPAGLSGFILN